MIEQQPSSRRDVHLLESAMRVRRSVSRPEPSEQDAGAFWDHRYSTEGAIWGEQPSPTAELAAAQLGPGSRVLDVGFGYGRDMAYLMRVGLKVCGIELSHEGERRARLRFEREGVAADEIRIAPYGGGVFPPDSFDLILSHRMAHLLTADADIRQFAHVTSKLLRPGGLLCVGARDVRDLEPAAMREVAEGVFEYLHRPGHQIRYWDEAGFQRVFGQDFEIVSLTQATEDECASRPVPCRLTIMLARKR